MHDNKFLTTYTGNLNLIPATVSRVTVFVGISHDAQETVQNPSGFLSAAHFWRFK